MIILIEFGDDALEAVEGGEHDHEGETQIDDSAVLLRFGELSHLNM